MTLPASAYGDEPSPLPVPTLRLTDQTDVEIRCPKCSKLLAEFATRPYQVRCPRCKTVKGAQPVPR